MRTRLLSVFTGVAMAVVVPVSAAAGYDQPRFTRACTKATNLEKTTCSCMGKKAEERLTLHGFNFLIASFEGDQNRADALRERMNMGEITDSSMFLVVAPRECASEGY